jgi:alkylhydroperoxidase family enzyme
LARRYGATEEELSALEEVEQSSLPAAERDSILFAEKMTRDHRSIGDADIDRLRAHWETDQIVELLCVIGLFNYLNRFAEALALEPTKPGEGGPEKREGEANVG